MSKILLAIKPEYVNKIFSGEKKFEYRTVVPTQVVDTIIIYETSPISKIVGEFSVSDVLIDSPDIIWSQTQSFGPGISKKDFKKYYAGKTQSVAFVIGKVKKYRKPKLLEDFDLSSPPQSYVYIK